MTTSASIHYRVTAALISVRGRLFIAQRPPNKKFGLCWEFPGGKVDAEESLQDCLQREIKEELNWEIEVGQLFEHICHEYEDFRIDLFAFWSRIHGGKLKLREHIACDWVSIPALRGYVFTEADRLLIERLERLASLPDGLFPTETDSGSLYGICYPDFDLTDAKKDKPPRL